MSSSWKDWNHEYPFKGLNDPEYIKAKEKTFKESGNGWWWGKGWWSDEVPITPMERNRMYRKLKEEQNGL